jgi:hypothetical protein
LDKQGCDAALFSLFSVVPRESFDVQACFKNVRSIKAVLFEEFHHGNERCPSRYVVYHKTKNGWKEYEFEQVFSTLTGIKEDLIRDFVNKEMPQRVLGNCCVLLCGESNGVKYSPKIREVHDLYGMTRAIPEHVKIILNPIHDRMTRFEMNLKRKFLSRNNRWVVSVWNKGKKFKDGKARDGDGPAWTVFRDGKEVLVERLPNELGVEIGTLDIQHA